MSKKKLVALWSWNYKMKFSFNFQGKVEFICHLYLVDLVVCQQRLDKK